jgi:hypothetical protein
MQEHLPGFAELGVSHHQHTGVPVDLVTIKAAGLPVAQAADRHEPDQRLVRGSPKWRREPTPPRRSAQ